MSWVSAVFKPLPPSAILFINVMSTSRELSVTIKFAVPILLIVALMVLELGSRKCHSDSLGCWTGF